MSINSKEVYVSDYALVEVGEYNYVYKPYSSLSSNQQRLLREVGYGPTTYKDRPLLKRIFDECYMVVDLTGKKDANYYTILSDLFRKLETDKGLKLTVITNIAGAKMGGKRFPVYFIGPNRTLQDWAKEMDIYDELYVNMTPIKRFEREKKFLGDWTLFKNKPRVKFIPDMPKFPGIAFINPEFRKKEELLIGFKLSGPAKETVLDFPSNITWDADLVLQHSGNKLKLSPEKFARLAGYSPNLSPDKVYSKDLTTTTKKGNIIEGRDPNFGLDLQATLGIVPDIDLTNINLMLDWKFTDDMKEKHFMFKDTKTNTLKLNNIGYEIFERKTTLTNETLRREFYKVLTGAIRRMIRLNVSGVFGKAVPLELAPAEIKHKAKYRVVVGYSGGLVAKAKAIVYDKLIYIDSSVWLAMGRDYDGDLAFLFPFRCIPNKKIISDLATLKEWYTLPDKPNDINDTRDDIESLMDNLKQSRLCGMMYNNGKIFIDACRMSGLSEEVVTKWEIKVMAMVEVFIFGFKGRVTSTEVPSAYDLATKFCAPEVMKHIPEVIKYFYVIRSRGKIKIDNKKYHSLEALSIRGKSANPYSAGWWERAVSKFKWLGVNLQIDSEAQAHANLKEDEPIHSTKIVANIEETKSKSSTKETNMDYKVKVPTTVKEFKTVAKKTVKSVKNSTRSIAHKIALAIVNKAKEVK